MLPVLAIHNRQRGVSFDLPLIRAIADAARESCLAAVKSSAEPLASLAEVDVSILSDRAIGVVHAEFFADPDPTDVITFQHGELLLGAGILVENAARYGHTPSEEAALCVIHGLLHLGGWNDLTKRDADKMARKQEHIFQMAREMLESRD